MGNSADRGREYKGIDKQDWLCVIIIKDKGYIDIHSAILSTFVYV